MPSLNKNQDPKVAQTPNKAKTPPQPENFFSKIKNFLSTLSISNFLLYINWAIMMSQMIAAIVLTLFCLFALDVLLSQLAAWKFAIFAGLGAQCVILLPILNDKNLEEGIVKSCYIQVSVGIVVWFHTFMFLDGNLKPETELTKSKDFPRLADLKEC